jgi:hypothetical protein
MGIARTVEAPNECPYCGTDRYYGPRFCSRMKGVLYTRRGCTPWQ